MKTKILKALTALGLAHFALALPIHIKSMVATFNLKLDFEETCDVVQICDEELEMLDWDNSPVAALEAETPRLKVIQWLTSSKLARKNTIA